MNRDDNDDWVYGPGADDYDPWEDELYLSGDDLWDDEDDDWGLKDDCDCSLCRPDIYGESF